MIIRTDSPLPCALYAGAAPCNHPTRTALITRIDGNAWEFLPICAAHLQETADAGVATQRPRSYAWPLRGAAPAFDGTSGGA
jgi:hypothetical protein